MFSSMAVVVAGSSCVTAWSSMEPVAGERKRGGQEEGDFGAPFAHLPENVDQLLISTARE